MHVPTRRICDFKWLAIVSTIIHLTPTNAYAQIAFVQSAYAVPQTPQTAVTVSYASAQAAGDLNVVVVGWSDTTAHIAGVTDSKGNAYLVAVAPTVQPGVSTQTIYYAKNIQAAAAGANTVRVTFDQPARYPDVRVAEYRGIDLVNAFDVAVSATGSSTSSASGAATTTNANDLLIGANLVQTRTTGPGTGYTKRVITPQDGDVLEDRIVASTGSYSATAPISPSGGWIMQMVAFRAASGGGGDTQAPTAPSALMATAVSSSQINLAWTASTDDVGVINYLIERCQGVGCTTFVQVATSTTPNYSNTGLVAATIYSYRVRATDASNNLSAYSSVASATTLAGASDTTVPTVSLSAPAGNATVAGTAVTVSANASDNVGVAGVQFLLDDAALGTEDTTSPYSITWNTTTTVNGGHRLSARARDAAGNRGTAADVSVVVDNQAPTGSVVINGAAAATNSSTVTLTLAATDALSAVTQMRFSNNGTSYNAAVVYASTASWTLATGAGTKTVYAQFKDAVGNWSAASTDTIVLDTTAPTVSGVAAANITNSGATIGWTTNEPATSRVEYGTTTAYGQSTTLDSQLITAHSVGLTGLAALTTYNYRVRSLDAAGNERIGTNATFRTLSGPDTTPPSRPGDPTASLVSATQVLISWPASTDNVGVTGYYIYRDGVQVGSVTGTSYQDNGLSRATYTYTVVAHDLVPNLSTPSNPVSVRMPALIISNVAVSSLTSTTALITWTTDTPATTHIEYGPTTAYGSFTVENLTLTTLHSQTITGLAANTTFHFRVISADAADNHELSSDGIFATSPTGQAGVFQNEILISGMNLPTAVKVLPNGDMLILELGGKIWKAPAGATQVNPIPVLSLTNIGTQNGQQGLMDMTFDPGFANNHYYYVFYTLGSPNRDRVSRLTANADFSGTIAGSELVIYQDLQDADIEHHGGALNFGNDGKLYVTTGDHFNSGNSQDLTSPRGKLLRINSDGTVPTDNPFYDGNGPNYDAIWALGLRNPFRAFYDTVSDRLLIGDVGGNDYSTAQEEVNVGVRGANYGWPYCEGSSCASDPAWTSPLFSYPHNGRDASITGGFVYRGSQFPASYYGSYFYADYAQNWIRRLTFDANGNVSGDLPFEPSDGAPDGPYGDIVYLTQGPDGALYYVDLGYSDTTLETGISKIRRIRFIASNEPPTAVASAQPTEGLAPLDVSLSSAGSSDPEGGTLTFSWDLGDGAQSTAANPTHRYPGDGRYIVRLSVSDGTSTTLAAPLAISVGNRPEVTVPSPQNGVFFTAGEVITFSGDASDIEDGVLPPSAFTWNIDFLHEGHVHPGLPLIGAKNGTFTIPAAGHDFSGNTRYRITLTATDSTGLQSSQSVVIYPRKVNVTFDSSPSGVPLTLDGIPHMTPFVYDTLVGFSHTIDAPNQIIGPNVYTFGSWSDNGGQSHPITVSAVDAALIATYTVVQNPLPTGLVAGYRFSEGSGTTTADLSGNNNTGSLVGGPLWSAGKYGGGLSFQGVNYVDLGNAPSLQMTGSMTLTAWINISANPFDDGAIIAKLASTGWQLKTSPDTGVRTAAIQISSDGSDSIQRYSNTVLATKTWYHLAGVYNAAARTLSIYVNGVLDNGVLSSAVPPQQYNSPQNVNIAQRWGGPYNFLGTIDEPHVFNRALTAAEIQADMNTPR